MSKSFAYRFSYFFSRIREWRAIVLSWICIDHHYVCFWIMNQLHGSANDTNLLSRGMTFWYVILKMILTGGRSSVVESRFVFQLVTIHQQYGVWFHTFVSGRCHQSSACKLWRVCFVLRIHLLYRFGLKFELSSLDMNVFYFFNLELVVCQEFFKCDLHFLWTCINVMDCSCDLLLRTIIYRQ